MIDDDFAEFLKRVTAEARAGRVDAAVAVVRERMRLAESSGHAEVLADCYVVLLSVLAVTQDDATVQSVTRVIALGTGREQCRAFLARAREWYRGAGGRDKDAPTQIARLDRLDRLVSGSGRAVG